MTKAFYLSTDHCAREVAQRRAELRDADAAVAIVLATRSRARAELTAALVDLDYAVNNSSKTGEPE